MDSDGASRVTLDAFEGEPSEEAGVHRLDAGVGLRVDV